MLARDAAAELKAAGVQSPPLAAALEEIGRRVDSLRRALSGGPSRRDWAQLGDGFLEGLAELQDAMYAVAASLDQAAAGAGTSNCARRAQALAATLAGVRAASDETGVRWVEAGAAGFVVQFTPFETAARLRECVEARPWAWVFTSATLAIGGDFSHFAARVGLPDARTLCIDSPFDYRNQTRIFLPPRHARPASRRATATPSSRPVRRSSRPAAGARFFCTRATADCARAWTRSIADFRIRRSRCSCRARRRARRC